MSLYSDNVLIQAPIAFWRLNDTAGIVAEDSSLSEFDAAYSNVTLNGYISPDNSVAPLFVPASSSTVNLNASGINGAIDCSEGTMIAWIKVSNAGVWTDGSDRYVIEFRVNVNNRIRIYSAGGGSLIFRYKAGGVEQTKAVALSSAAWICVAMTWSAANNEMVAFVDGVPEAPVAGLGVWAGVPTLNYIGSFGGGSYFWDGSISLVQIYDRVLSDSVIASLSSIPDVAASPSSYIPHDLYDIRVYDHTGALQMLLEKWSRLSFTQRLNAPWNHQITLEFGYDDPSLEKFREILPDWIIEIYRTDPNTLISTRVYEGLNQTIVDQVRANGGIILNLYGVGYTQLIQRKVALPTAGQEYSTKTGLAEYVIKSYVNENAIGPADSDRTLPGLSTAADSGAGSLITYSARYVNLLSLCETVSEQGNLDFGVYGSGTVGEFIFDARSTWGKDLREGNSEGNIPVVFSIEKDNMLIPILSNNYSAEQNFAYVGGEGQGADRVIQEVYDGEAVARSPWSRKEFFVESRQQNSVSALIATGRAELKNKRAKQSLSFKVKQTDQSRWIQDWNLGDLISAKYYDYLFDKQIVEISVELTQGSAESIDVQFDEIRLAE